MFLGDLHPYQQQAVERMVERGNMLVAFDMGTGKTVMTIAAIERLMARRKIESAGLVIALSSLKYQWQQQIHKFSDSRALVIDGTPKQRAEQYDQARRWYDCGWDWIILNYEQIVNDWEQVQSLPRGFVVLDEATAIKSFRSKRSKRVKKMADAPYRYALTGTPAENGKPEELFSIFQFVDKDLLGSPQRFDQRYIRRNVFGGVERYVRMDELHERISPAMVRKRQTDPDVAPFMPATIEPEPVLVPMGPAARQVYNRIRDDLLSDLDEAQSLGITGTSFNVMAHYGSGVPTGMDKDAGAVLGRVGAKLTALRMFCADSVLLESVDTDYVNALRQDGVFGRGLGSPKLNAVVRYANDHLEADERNKIVIFTHWVGMADRLVEQFYGSGAVGYTGKMNARQKEHAKREFQDSPNVRVLVSSDAGGYGVDLPQANLLINYDLADTAGADAQRRSRIKRASSTWPTVVVQDFLIRGSVEQRMRDALRQKAGVQAAVIDGEGITRDGTVLLTLGSLSKFLRTGPGVG